MIAIIALLLGLLLPAVMAARAAMQRADCDNNLKQIGVALASYESSQGAFPVSTTGSAAGGHGGFYSWLALILPQVEQTNLHASINFDVAMADTFNQAAASDYQTLSISSTHLNAAAAATPVQVYLCPSDAPRPSTILGNAQPAPGSYAGNSGWVRGSKGIDGSLAPLAQHNGFLGVLNPKSPDPWQRGYITRAHIRDGLSNTAAVSERLISSATSLHDLANSPVSLHSYCAGGGGSRSQSQWINYCGSVSLPDPIFSLPQGRSWISGWTLAGNNYMHMMPINGRNCHLYGGEDDGNNMVSASSHHAGGANVLMGDGRVLFMSDTMDQAIWWSIGTRDGGETHSLP